MDPMLIYRTKKTIRMLWNFMKNLGMNGLLFGLVQNGFPTTGLDTIKNLEIPGG